MIITERYHHSPHIKKVSKLERNRLVGFVAKVMEESGFKVYRNFKTSRHLIDIYGVLSTVLGDIGVVVACKNYDERWKVGLDVLKEMEMVAKNLKASKVVIVTTSQFTDNAINYASRRNIKLIDKNGLMNLAKAFSRRELEVEETETRIENEDLEYIPASGKSSTGFITHGRRILLNSKKRETFFPTIGPRMKVLLSNTIVLIIIVLLLSTFIAFIFGSIGNVMGPILRIIEILSAAILSYGLVFYVDRDSIKVLVKGTTVFFVTLLIYILAILF